MSRSTSSDAGTPSDEGAAPGRKRAPTTVVAGPITSTPAAVRGPTRRGAEPTRQAISRPPFGTVRCVYGAAPGATSWTHRQETNAASAGRRGQLAIALSSYA